VLRNSDVKCRYGGEEFLVLLPETPIQGARHVAETLRRELAELTVPLQEHSIRCTASFGVSSAMPGESDAKALIARADAALYRAKEDGRNCVRIETQSTLA
jgi:diguanylate cyclase (GGDEF)-like protein